MSIFENMNAKEIAMCLSAFYEAAKKYTQAQLYGTQVYLPGRGKSIDIDRSDYDEGIKILREEYEVFWTPDIKPDDLKGNDYLYRRELGLPDDATVADILEKIRRLMNESCVLNSKVLKLEDADKLRRHWHAKYEEEHKECVRLSKLHAADKEKKDKQDAVIQNLRDNNVTLENSVAALKKRIRSMEAEAAEKETKNKVITDTLRDNLVDSIEECKRLNGRIRLLEDQLKLNGVPPLKDPLDSDS